MLRRRGSWRANARRGEACATGVPTRPAWLSLSERQAWARITNLLLAQGTLAEIDGNAVAAYCREWANWRQADELARKAEPGSVERSRLVAERNAAAALVLKIGSKLGMSPSDRAGLPAQPTPQGDDPKLRFFEESA